LVLYYSIEEEIMFPERFISPFEYKPKLITSYDSQTDDDEWLSGIISYADIYLGFNLNEEPTRMVYSENIQDHWTRANSLYDVIEYIGSDVTRIDVYDKHTDIFIENKPAIEIKPLNQRTDNKIIEYIISEYCVGLDEYLGYRRTTFGKKFSDKIIKQELLDYLWKLSERK
jgi:hypothetical protein